MTKLKLKKIVLKEQEYERENIEARMKLRVREIKLKKWNNNKKLIEEKERGRR